MQENIPQSLQAENEVGFLSYLVIVLEHKEFILKATISAVLVAIVVSLLIPPTYLAETRILLPQSSSSSMASLMASQMVGMGIPPSALGVKTTNDLYVSLLKTKPVADHVIDKCGVMQKYHLESREQARKMVASGLILRDEKKSGIITIGFQNRKPQVAAEIANAYVEGLQKLTNTLAVTEAGQRRLFFEQQLNAAKENLVRSEENLKYFQQRTGTIKIDDEAKAVIGTVAEMRARISAKEVQLRVMRTYSTAENPDYLRLQDEVKALRDELRKMESVGKVDGDSVPTIGRMSSIGTEYIRRMREFRYNEALYEMLIKQFEAAKLDESKDAALVQVIERAEVPEKKIKPRRKEIVINVGVTAFVFFCMAVLFRSYFGRVISNPENKAAIDDINKYLDFSKLKDDLISYFHFEKIYRYLARK